MSQLVPGGGGLSFGTPCTRLTRYAVDAKYKAGECYKNNNLILDLIGMLVMLNIKWVNAIKITTLNIDFEC